MRGWIPTSIARMALLSVVALMQAAPAATASGTGQEGEEAPAVVGELIVRFADNASPGQERTAVDQADATISEQVSNDLINAAVVKVEPGTSLDEVIDSLEQSKKVLYAEPNYIVHAFDTPNDPLFSDMWNLLNDGMNGYSSGADINATSAWDQSKGSCDVVVAITDTGIDSSHPDLSSNIWFNAGETASNGVDDDGNGYVDDVNGADFINGDGNPYDDHGHGSHVAGTIGAVGNNSVGVVGVNQRVRLMGLKFLDADGFGTTADAIRAIEYATENGADVINASWGGGGYERALHEAIRATSAIFVAAAGNSGENNDYYPQYPASFNEPNVISVAASTSADTLASYSNYGVLEVDLAAPGSNILSTVPGGYATFSGTSMATPHVAGAAALMLSTKTDATPDQIRSAMMSSAYQAPDLQGLVASGGRLNVAGALSALGGGSGPDASAECDGSVAPPKPKPGKGPSALRMLSPKNNSVYFTRRSRRSVKFRWRSVNAAENVRYYLIKVNGKTYKKVKDLDGPGGRSAKSKARIKLKANKSYYAYIVAVDYLGNRSTSLKRNLRRSSKARLGQHFWVMRRR